MSVTQTAQSITMTADDDAITDERGQPFEVVGLSFQGTSLTADQRLRLTDGVSTIADYIVEGTSDNADLWAGRVPQKFHKLKVEDGPSGTWVVTFFLRA